MRESPGLVIPRRSHLGFGGQRPQKASSLVSQKIAWHYETALCPAICTLSFKLIVHSLKNLLGAKNASRRLHVGVWSQRPGGKGQEPPLCEGLVEVRVDQIGCLFLKNFQALKKIHPTWPRVTHKKTKVKMIWFR